MGVAVRSKPLTEPEIVHPALVNLNDEQRAAAVAIEHPTLLVAPAGTGKTAVLTARYRYLLQEGLNPNELLAITFSNKAANEMLDRLHDDVADYKERDVWILTFHKLGKRILESDPTLFGLTESFRIADERETQTIMKEAIRCIDPERLDDPHARDLVAKTLQTIDEIKSAGFTPSAIAETMRFKGRAFTHDEIEIMEEYDIRLNNENLCDFSDLILKPVLAFRANPEFARKWRRPFKAIMIDEFQDTNGAQYELLRFMTEGKSNVLAAGDDDQLIFAWRGATNSHVLDFKEQWIEPQIVKLRANYRNAPKILAHAQSLISHNELRLPKNIVAMRDKKGIVDAYVFDDPNEEQAWIADMVELQRDKEIPLDQIAILTRTRQEAERIALTLAARDIPHYYPDNDLIRSAEVIALTKWARVVQDDTDRLSMMETMVRPTCGLTNAMVNKLSDYAVSHGSTLIQTMRNAVRQGLAQSDGPVANYLSLLDAAKLVDLTSPAPFRQLANAVGLDAHAGSVSPAALEVLKSAITIFDDMVEQLGSVTAVLDAIALNAAGIGRSHGADPKVQVNTMHAAKGLEFSCVIAPAWEEGLFPFDSRNAADIDEARRLAYVTMTRARDSFYITVCRKRPNRGAIRPSRFLADAQINNPMA